MLVKINRSQILDWMASKSPRNIQPISSLGIFLDLTRPYLDRRNRKNDLVSISNTIFYETYFSNTLTTMKVAKSRAMSRTEFIFLIFLIWRFIYLFLKWQYIEKNCVPLGPRLGEDFSYKFWIIFNSFEEDFPESRQQKLWR